MGYQSGTSEIFLGRAIKELTNRQNVVIATKYMPRTQEQIKQGISAKEHIEKCLNDSLKRLDMDYVDLYIMHRYDYDTPIEETMNILHDLVKSGKVKTIGISNCYAWQLAKANEYAKNNDLTPFVSVQGHYNLIFREEEREMKPYCDSHHVALTPYSALASGRLAKMPGSESKRLKEDQYAKGKYDASKEVDALIIERVIEIAKAKDVSMTEISLAWLLTKTTSPIIGATKLHHIDGAIKALNTTLTNEEIAYLEAPYVPHKLVGVMAQ